MTHHLCLDNTEDQWLSYVLLLLMASQVVPVLKFSAVWKYLCCIHIQANINFTDWAMNHGNKQNIKASIQQSQSSMHAPALFYYYRYLVINFTFLLLEAKKNNSREKITHIKWRFFFKYCGSAHIGDKEEKEILFLVERFVIHSGEGCNSFQHCFVLLLQRTIQTNWLFFLFFSDQQLGQGNL